MSKSDRRAFLKNVGKGALAAGFGFALPAHALQDASPAVGTKQSLADPLPPSEARLPQINPKPWLRIDSGNVFLKGMAFDRNNDLLVMAAYPGKVDKSMAGRVDRSILRITPTKAITTVIKQRGVRLCDHAIHKDGRIFIACLTGELLVVNPDGSELKPITTRWKGKPEELSDLTFDSDGNLYVTDFTGKPGNPTGGVYRWSPDFQSVEPLMPNLVTPNGIAFGPDEKSLWVSCSLAKEISHLTLDDTRKRVQQPAVLYKLNGPGGDGIRVDVQGNMYLALNFQGRVLIFDKHGVPVASVLMPGRDRGELLSTTNVAFKPGTDEVYAVASGEAGGSWIYKFQGLARGVPPYSHR
jgi:lactonase